MNNLNLLVVEGNLQKENENFKNSGIPTHAESLKESLSYYTNDLNIDVFNPCAEKSFQSFLNWVLELRKELNIPHKLSEIIDVKKINLDQLSKMALEDPSTGTNPKKLTIDDMKILYEHSISGKLF